MKKLTFYSLFFFLFLYCLPNFAQTGILRGQGGDANWYTANWCGNETFRPREYYLNNLGATPSMPFVRFTLNNSNPWPSASGCTNWGVYKENWTISSTNGGTVTGINSGGGTSTLTWTGNDIIGPVRYSGGSPILITLKLGNGDSIIVRQDSFAITLNAPPAAYVTSSKDTLCTGQSSTLTAHSGISSTDWVTSYSWSTGASTQSITASSSGTYMVTITNRASNTTAGDVGCNTLNNCSFVRSVTITDGSITAALTTLSDTICFGDSTTLTANATPTTGTTYSWNTGATTTNIKAGSGGTYSVTVTSKYGCTAVASKSVTQIQCRCNDSCYWTLAGNTNVKSWNYIGTFNNADLKIRTNNQQRMVVEAGGNIGIATSAPSSKLHVDLTGLSASTGLRFQNLQTSTENHFVVVNGATGDVTRRQITSVGNTNNTCATTDYVPKLNSTNSYSCSQIFDNGTSVGVGSSSGFAYTSLAGGTWGTTVPASTGNVKLEVNGVLRSLASIVTSDAKYKSAVKPLDNALEIIARLSSKTYFWNETARQTLGADNGLHIGYIAQELEKVLPNLVITDDNGDKAINYTELIPILTQALNEQQQKNNALEQKLELLESKLNSICEKGCGSVKEPANSIDNSIINDLYQNVPNPFSNETTIGYTFNKGNSASIKIVSLDGKLIRSFDNIEKGAGSVNLKASDLQSGTYTYTLIIDGKALSTKLMVIARN